MHFDIDTKDGEKISYDVIQGLGAGAPVTPGNDNEDLPDRLCTNGGVGCSPLPLDPEDKQDDSMPDRLCTVGDVGCVLPPDDRDNKAKDEMLPDRLCQPGDLNCMNRDAGLPDRLCADGTWGCHSNGGLEDDAKHDGGTIINIFDDWFGNSAVGLREIATTALGISCSALMLSSL